MPERGNRLLAAAVKSYERRERKRQEFADANARFVDAVNAARAAGVSVTDLSAATGLSRQAIYHLLGGEYGVGKRPGRPKR